MVEHFPKIFASEKKTPPTASLLTPQKQKTDAYYTAETSIMCTSPAHILGDDQKITEVSEHEVLGATIDNSLS